MDEHTLIGLASIVALGIGAQWLAWRLHFPGILLLLVFGFFAGPVFSFIDPDALLGQALVPIVSLSVGIILFEGGLDLRFHDLKRVGKVVRNLVTVGTLVTWVLSSIAAVYVLEFSKPIAILFGSILTVTGPTVIIPLLRHIRLAGRGVDAGLALKWEGIVIDPIGAVLAVLVFEAILVGALGEAALIAFSGVLKVILVGGVMGAVSAWALIFVIKRFWVPDFLQNPVALSLVVSSFAVSNHLQHESGLLTVTVMGILLANQKSVQIRELVYFKENLRVLLISTLFIMLSARMDIETLNSLNLWRVVAFLGLLIFVVRPIAVMISTRKSDLSFRERLFICSIAPRGIVAASVASIFSIQLLARGYPGAEQLLPVTFLVIVGTVTVYGLFAPIVARVLELSQPNPQGVMLIGAHRWARELGVALRDAGCKVILVDTNRQNISAARALGLPTQHSTIFFDHSADELVLDGIGRLIAMTSNDEVNTLAALHFTDVFGRKEVYQLQPNTSGIVHGEDGLQSFRSRILFSKDINYPLIENRMDHGAQMAAIPNEEELSIEEFVSANGEGAVPMFATRPSGEVTIFTADGLEKVPAGSTVICLLGGMPANLEAGSSS